MADALATQGLTKRFGDKVAVNHLSLHVAEGEFFGFLGPNGAGKSTTIKMVTGLLRPTAGQVLIRGIDLWRQPIKAKALLGVLPEDLNLYERLTGREFVGFAGAMYGLSKPEVARRAGELLQVLDLADDADKLIIDYSHGMRKKIALAAALIHTPAVLFLDEPFEGVDAISGRAIRDVLNQLRASGTTIFFSTHVLEVAQKLCTRIGIIARGSLVAEGSLDELRAQAMTEHADLETLFLDLVGADEAQRTLSWLEQ